jgi:hypothetical protein
MQARAARMQVRQYQVTSLGSSYSLVKKIEKKQEGADEDVIADIVAGISDRARLSTSSSGAMLSLCSGVWHNQHKLASEVATICEHWRNGIGIMESAQWHRRNCQSSPDCAWARLAGLCSIPGKPNPALAANEETFCRTQPNRKSRRAPRNHWCREEAVTTLLPACLPA